MAVILGNARSNLLQGTATADAIFGGGGNDTLYGDRGADSLYGGEGNDLLDGGAAADLLDGGAGNDTVTYALNLTPVTVDLANGVATFDNPGWLPETLRGIENAIGGSAGDLLIGDDRDNVLNGRAGNDTLIGGAGEDVFVTGPGDDVVYGVSQDFSDGFYSGSNSYRKPNTVRYDALNTAVTFDGTNATFANNPTEVDRLYNIQNIWTGSGADSVTGTAEANELRGGGGNDTLAGLAGDDTLWGQGGTDLLDGGDGFDTVTYSDNTTPVLVNLATGLVSFPGMPWLPETVVSIENAVGGSGNDTLIGDDLVNVLDGGLGSDLIDGGAGQDVASFASQSLAVQVDLAAQRAVTVGTPFVDTLVSIEHAFGSSGNDTLVGTARGNRLDGGLGDDWIHGGAGDDRVLLSAGNDTLNGGAGVDTLVWNVGYDKLFNIVIEDAGSDPVGDWFIYGGSTQPDVIIDLAGWANWLYGGGSAVLAGIENVQTGVGNDVIYGTNEANVISVGLGANNVDGRGGNDTIVGSGTGVDFVVSDTRTPHEVLLGGNGNDRIVAGEAMFGDAGNDALVAGWNLGEMSGGTGADIFWFTDDLVVDEMGRYTYIATQSASILDFDASEGDRIVIDLVDPTPQQLPQFIGIVENRDDVAIGQYARLGDSLYMPLIEYDDIDQTGVEGLMIYIAGGFEESDILFV